MKILNRKNRKRLLGWVLGSLFLVAPPAEAGVRYLHGDHLGSASVTSDVNGTIVELAAYSPFGELLSEKGKGSPLSHLYTSQELDRSTELYYYGARYYDPTLSLFLTVDPVEGNPPYAYGYNNPIVFTDPSGREPLRRTVTSQQIRAMVDAAEDNFWHSEIAITDQGNIVVGDFYRIPADRVPLGQSLIAHLHLPQDPVGNSRRSNMLPSPADFRYALSQGNPHTIVGVLVDKNWNVKRIYTNTFQVERGSRGFTLVLGNITHRGVISYQLAETEGGGYGVLLVTNDGSYLLRANVRPSRAGFRVLHRPGRIPLVRVLGRAAPLILFGVMLVRLAKEAKELTEDARKGTLPTNQNIPTWALSEAGRRIGDALSGKRKPENVTPTGPPQQPECEAGIACRLGDWLFGPLAGRDNGKNE